ncbi:glycerophosphodiester phosphodiesterase [Alphaproteobacteria bacterium]|nr:glycerophosphodiester phosphodiesterase [Alphaproteobacteria bacterium]MDA8624262.1 glycerophosphodiester phosphodiesterase [Alphaproteobacteria bacterium]MDA8625592.1 glycerophosphodiester phosphodiesterase [Alphaproteobacteria bacterium]MDA8642692.1 glycerophosphodiester phosphodiesterase [Alphaproteobacteria bacterium]MDA8666924.1 glycerophosphodiester phosphodiesterase [Alphaproteobacteria bacterium]
MRPSAKYKYLDHQGVLAFAHRGGDRVALENTMAAFQNAVGQGYRYLETDVHASKDGVVYAFHDDDLNRMVGEDMAISTLTAAEIDGLQMHGEHHIPTMAELFETFPEARFNIDAKAWPVVEPLIALINKTQTHERICIGSFSDARIKAVRRGVGDVCHSVGPMGAARFRLGACGRLRLSYSAGAVQFPVSEFGVPMVTPASVAYAHRRGLQVHVWTINDESTMHRLLDMGVDGVMTDDCALLKKVLLARNLW